MIDSIKWRNLGLRLQNEQSSSHLRPCRDFIGSKWDTRWLFPHVPLPNASTKRLPGGSSSVERLVPSWNQSTIMSAHAESLGKIRFVPGSQCLNLHLFPEVPASSGNEVGGKSRAGTYVSLCLAMTYCFYICLLYLCYLILFGRFSIFQDLQVFDKDKI